MNGGKKRKKGDPPGAGHSGSTSRMTRAEEVVHAKGLEGKTDISNRPKYIAALNAEHKRTGEPKSSGLGRKKRKPTVSKGNRTRIGVLDTATGKRIPGKKKLTPAQKAKAKRAKENATAGRSRAEKKLYKNR